MNILGNTLDIVRNKLDAAVNTKNDKSQRDHLVQRKKNKEDTRRIRMTEDRLERANAERNKLSEMFVTTQRDIEISSKEARGATEIRRG